MMTSTFFFLVPMVYLSGFIFPIENMPRAIQCLTTLVPLRYFLVIVRGIFLKGIGFDLLWPQFAALARLGRVVLSLAHAWAGVAVYAAHADQSVRSTADLWKTAP